MRYIRTFSGIIVDTEQQAKRLGMSVEEYENKFPYSYSTKADTIEELCDEFVSITEDLTPEILVPKYISPKDTLTNAWKNRFEDEMCYKNVVIYGAIWTDKGLIYVAKMNEKGELELI